MTNIQLAKKGPEMVVKWALVIVIRFYSDYMCKNIRMSETMIGFNLRLQGSQVFSATAVSVPYKHFMTHL